MYKITVLYTLTLSVISRCLHESILLGLLSEVMACVLGCLCMAVHQQRKRLIARDNYSN